MASYIHYLDPFSKELDEVISKLQRTPGTCIFIDLINSTADKILHPDNSWIKKLNNTFNFISVINQFPNFVVKGIGDEMMLYLPDDELQHNKTFNNYLALLGELHATVETLINHPLKNLFYECKVGIHYCTNVYNITFFDGVNDYYGTDIDASARLMQKSRGNRIVLSEDFYQRALADCQNQKRNPENTILSRVSGIYIEDFKGLDQPFKYRAIEV